MDTVTVGISIFICGILYRLGATLWYMRIRRRRCLGEQNLDMFRHKYRIQRYIGLGVMCLGAVVVGGGLFH